MATKSQSASKMMMTILVGSCGLFALANPDWRSEVRAQGYAPEWTLPVIFTAQLFDAVPTFDTGPITSPGEAVPFGPSARPSTDCEGGGGVGVCRLDVGVGSGEVAVISSREEGPGEIVIDNFMTINGANVCDRVPSLPEQLFPGSCFGEILSFDFPTDVPIETVLDPIPPVDVTAFLPFGTSDTLDFELHDFGEIAGNTDLFLVILQVPQRTRAECQAEALRDFENDLAACAVERDDCEQQLEQQGFVPPGFCIAEEDICRREAQEELNRKNEECLKLPE